MDTELGKAYYTPTFELTAEEVEIVKELCYGKFTLSTFPSDYEKKIRHLYDRIKQWQDENNRTD